jgi:hypothetical protein
MEVFVSKVHQAPLDPDAVVTTFVLKILHSVLIKFPDVRHISFRFFNLDLCWLYQIHFREFRQEGDFGNPADASTHVNSSSEA